MSTISLAWAFVKRDFFQETSYRLSFVWQVGSLVFSLALLYFLAGMFPGAQPEGVARYSTSYFPFAVVGFSMAEAMWTCVSSFSSRIRYDQVVGTLEAMAASPRPLPLLVVCSGLYPLLSSGVRLVLFLAAALAAGASFDRSGLLLSLPVLLLSLLTFSAIGLISAAMTLVLKRGDPVAALLSALSFLFGGALYPVSALPDGLEWVSSLLPISYAIEAVRKLALSGATLGEVAPEIAILSAFAAASISIAWTSVRWADKVARRSGVRNY